MQDAVTALKAKTAASDDPKPIDPEVYELRRMPRVPVKPSLQNGMQVARRRRFFELSFAKSHAFAQSKRAARIEQLLRDRGIYECDVPETAVEKQ